MAGQNALFKFNGVDIIREENEVEDLICRYKTDSLIQPQASQLLVHLMMLKSAEDICAFVAELKYSISESYQLLTFRGTPGEDDEGPLASDNLAKSYLRTLKNLTIKPIIGYGDEDVFLSNFGVMTERDGSLP